MTISLIPSGSPNPSSEYTELTAGDYGDPIPVFDARQLYTQCVEHGISTDWWYSKANTINLVAGFEPSEAYLLLQYKYIIGASAADNAGTVIPAINRSTPFHKISLMDAVRESLSLDPLEIGGWWIHSFRAIDGSSSREDPDALYLVKLVDRRYLANLQTNVNLNPADSTVGNYNVISVTRDESGMEFDANDAEMFPYDLETISADAFGGGRPWTWEELLADFWSESIKGLGTTIELSVDTIPYPDRMPIDIRCENDSPWKCFCNLLHSVGGEVYPYLDGTFRVGGISDDWDNDELAPTSGPGTLNAYKSYLIEAGHGDGSQNHLPYFMRMEYKLRSRDADLQNQNSYFMTGRYRTLESIPQPSDGDVDSLIDADDVTLTFGEEVITTYAMSLVAEEEDYINGPGTSGPRSDNPDRVAFEELVLARYCRSRVQATVDHTYGFFLGLPPNSQYESVTYFIAEGGPATHFKSLPSMIGVAAVATVGGGGGSGIDRLVAANPDSGAGADGDQTPATLIEKITDIGTYNSSDYVPVYAEVTYDVGGDPRNNTVKLFAPKGLGEPGPPGSPGAPGADGPTYTDGCGIVIAGTTVALFANDLVSTTIQIDPDATTTCSIAVNANGMYSVGGGLHVATDDNRKLKIAPEELYEPGGGLMECAGNTLLAAGPVKLRVDPSALAGCGLRMSDETAIAYGTGACEGPVKLTINLDELIGGSGAEDGGLGRVAGDQTDNNGPCKIKVKTNKTVQCLDPDHPPTLTVSGGNLTLTIPVLTCVIYSSGTASDTIVVTTPVEACP